MPPTPEKNSAVSSMTENLLAAAENGTSEQAVTMEDGEEMGATHDTMPGNNNDADGSGSNNNSNNNNDHNDQNDFYESNRTTANTTNTTTTMNEPSIRTGATMSVRTGTISSARFNILCTMVGGGCLSLPFGFQKSGNALLGPILLIVTAMITEFCFRIIVATIRKLSPVHGNGNGVHGTTARTTTITMMIGQDSFESMANAAFGKYGFLFAKHLVTAMCFFGAVGYAVLLRDMLQPISDAIARHIQNNHENDHDNGHHHHGNGTLPDDGNGTIVPDGSNYTLAPTNSSDNGTMSFMFMYDRMLVDAQEYEEGNDNTFQADSSIGGEGPTLISNLTMLTIILLITPVCTLKNLSSLEKMGAMSMSSILILGCVITYRSFQCNMGTLESFLYENDGPSSAVSWPAFQLWPDSWQDVLDAFPLFVSCYVCHYNIPAVHNELQNPTPKRVNYWLRSTTVAATTFYLVVGLAGSAYGHCTPTGKVQGNVLLDFDEDDPLLLVARMCLACTLTMAFPLLVIPARDILLRDWFTSSTTTTNVSVTITTDPSPPETLESPTFETAETSLREPLLANDENGEDAPPPPPPPPRTSSSEQTAQDTVAARATAVATATARSVVAQPQQHSFILRLGMAILVLWSAAAVACSVKSIDIVWDLLGSSLSIFLSYLIPCGSFIIIMEQSSQADEDEEDGNSHWKRKGALLFAKIMLAVYIPLMLISTGNAVVHTFF